MRVTSGKKLYVFTAPTRDDLPLVSDFLGGERLPLYPDAVMVLEIIEIPNKTHIRSAKVRILTDRGATGWVWLSWL